MLSNSLKGRQEWEGRLKSLKGSHCNSKHHSLTKRHSLDARPLPLRKRYLLDNAEDYIKPHPLRPQDCFKHPKSKFSCRRNNKTSKSAEKGKVKRNWSELGKQKPSKERKHNSKADANLGSLGEGRN